MHSVIYLFLVHIRTCGICCLGVDDETMDPLISLMEGASITLSLDNSEKNYCRISNYEIGAPIL